MSQKLAERFRSLQLYIKCLFIGISLSLSGLFLNWFKSADSFGNGISYNAFNGPTWLMGYTVLVISIYSLGALLRYLKTSDCERTLLKKYYVEKWSGVIIMYLSLIVASIYMSSDFLNNYDKNIGIGFFITLTGSLITVSGSILFKTKKSAKIEVDENQLNLELGEIEGETAQEDDNGFGFNTKNLINKVIEQSNPDYKDISKKQREIEAKILQK
jgi:hypothetical protein